MVEAAFRLGGKKAAWELVVANRKRVRCPQCSGKANERNGGGCACGGTGVLDPRHCEIRLLRLLDPVARAMDAVGESLSRGLKGFIGWSAGAGGGGGKPLPAVLQQAQAVADLIRGRTVTLVLIDDALKGLDT